MNWAAIAGTAAIVSTLVNVLALLKIAFAAGEVVQQVKDHERRIQSLEGSSSSIPRAQAVHA